MKTNEDTFRTLAVGVLAWIATVAGAARSGLLADVALEESIAAGLFAIGFALAAYRLDAELGDYLRSAPHLPTVALALDAVIVASFAAGPFVPGLLAAAPLAVVAHAALLARRPRAPVLRSPAAKSPGARPAAT